MDRKRVVRRFVDEAVNGGRDEVIDELFTEDMAARTREWFGAFRSSFPDMHIELLELVAEVYFFKFSGGRIAAAWGIEDSLERFRQLGLDPAV